MQVFVVKHHGAIARICKTHDVAFNYIKRTVLDILELEETQPDFVTFINNLEAYDKSGSWVIEEWEVAK